MSFILISSPNAKNEKPKPALIKGKERNVSTKRNKGNQRNLGTRVLVFSIFFVRC